MNAVTTEPAPPQDQRRDGKVLRIISRVEMAFGVFFFGTMLVGALWQALGRHLPILSWPGAGEIARYSLVSLTFIMIGFLVGHGGHVTVAIIDSVVSGRVVRVVRVIAAAIVAVCCALLTWGGIDLVISGANRTSEVLAVPLSGYYLVPLVGFALGTIRAIVLILRSGEPEPTPPTFDEVSV